jgi:hypothetical protein
MPPWTRGKSMGDSSYKVRGLLDDGTGVGVLGHNTASSGTPIGVEGVVESPGGFGLYTDDDCRVGGTLTSHRVSVGDRITVDVTGSSGGDHGLEVIDRSTDNSEQISIKADPSGTGELVFQDTAESNYKWGLRASQDDTFRLENHDNLTTRVELVKQGPLNVYHSPVELHDEKLLASGNDPDGRAVDATGGSIRAAGGVVHRQRSEPTATELDAGETMTYNSDGSGTGDAGDLVYAINDGGTIKTQVIASRSDATA